METQREVFQRERNRENKKEVEGKEYSRDYRVNYFRYEAFERILLLLKRKTASSHFVEIIALRISAIGIALIPVGVSEFVALKTSAIVLPSRTYSGVGRREVLLKKCRVKYLWLAFVFDFGKF